MDKKKSCDFLENDLEFSSVREIRRTMNFYELEQVVEHTTPNSHIEYVPLFKIEYNESDIHPNCLFHQRNVLKTPSSFENVKQFCVIVSQQKEILRVCYDKS